MAEHKQRIEKRIKNLVELLNKTGYIVTHSSCEGHFNEGTDNPAHIYFTLRSNEMIHNPKSEIDELSRIILANTANDFSDGIVDIAEKRYVNPGEFPWLNKHFYLGIEISQGHEFTDSHKRNITDQFINKIEDAVKQYIAARIDPLILNDN